jgi:Protein of unknown function (DUF3592)
VERAAIARFGSRAHAVGGLIGCRMREPAYSRMNEEWKAPPELTGPIPRKLKWTQTGKINLYVVAFVVVFGFLIVSAFLGNAIGDHKLKEEAKETEGSVTRKWTQNGRGKTIYHYLAYSFAVGGQTFRGESHVPNAKWQTLATGSALGVRYVPSNPSNNRADIAFESPPMQYWIPLAAFAIWICFIYLSLYDVRKERMLLKYGQAGAGLIVTDDSRKTQPRYGWVTGYEFQLPDGSMRKGAVQRDRTWMRGQTVCILYDPKRPRRNGIYPLRMCEIVE